MRARRPRRSESDPAVLSHSFLCQMPLRGGGGETPTTNFSSPTLISSPLLTEPCPDPATTLTTCNAPFFWYHLPILYPSARSCFPPPPSRPLVLASLHPSTFPITMLCEPSVAASPFQGALYVLSYSFPDARHAACGLSAHSKRNARNLLSPVWHHRASGERDPGGGVPLHFLTPLCLMRRSRISSMGRQHVWFSSVTRSGRPSIFR